MSSNRLTRYERARLNRALDQLFIASRYGATRTELAEAVGWAASALAEFLDRRDELEKLHASSDIRVLSSQLCRENPSVCP